MTPQSDLSKKTVDMNTIIYKVCVTVAHCIFIYFINDF